MRKLTERERDEYELSFESTLTHDSDISQNDFRENFEETPVEGVWFFKDYGNAKMIEGEDLYELDSSRMSKDQKVKFLHNYGNFYIEEAEELSKSDLEDEVDTAIYDLMNDIENEFFNDDDFEDRANELSEFGIKLEYKDNIEFFDINGYSQGDFATVIVDTDQIKWNMEDSKIKDMFRNYFYGAPINGSIKIGNEEYYEEELFDDIYNSYDYKDDVIEKILKKTKYDKDIVRELLEDKLPNNLPYY